MRFSENILRVNKDDNIHKSSAKNSLKSLESQNLLTIPAIPPLTIRNGFLIKFYKANP